MSNTLDVTPSVKGTEECIPCQKTTIAFAPSGNGFGKETDKDTVLNHPTEEPPARAIAATVADYPTQEPPSKLTQQGVGAVAAGWQTDKKVTGLWRACGNDRNSYMYVDGIGWRKFADNSDSAIMAFSIIAAHAKTTGKGANYYEGDDGKVNTIYVW
jgi:hypothetical protein